MAVVADRFKTSLFALIVSGASVLGVAPARAASAPLPSPELNALVDASGTGNLVAQSLTSSIRAQVPVTQAPVGPRILIIGTGVKADLFPADLKARIAPRWPSAGSDLTDSHGYGTLAASVVFQMAPRASITSMRVTPLDSNWVQVNLDSLSQAMEEARVRSAEWDLILLAFPPSSALDPLTNIAAHLNYGGTVGRGLHLVVEGMLQNHARMQGANVAGIPADRALRDVLYAKANLNQRDAIERYVSLSKQWNRVTAAVRALSATGVGVVAPAGDFTRKQRGTGAVVPLSTQTVYGLSAMPEVITIGAAHNGANLSPTSGRGPTLGLGLKPDALAPSDVLGMMPADARLPWPDSTNRLPLTSRLIDWADPLVPDTACPDLTGKYRCVLEGSSMVAAAVAASNLAMLVARGTPHTAALRAPLDDEILRGITWSAASRTHAPGAYPWEEGAGILTGLASFDPSRTPVALAPLTVGETAWDTSESVAVPLWAGAATPDTARPHLDAFAGPAPTGETRTYPMRDQTRMSASVAPGVLTLTSNPARAQGGLYAGSVDLMKMGAQLVALPMYFVQDIPVDFSIAAGANGGERIEDDTVVLFAGLPPNVGILGEAWKTLASSPFAQSGGEPTNRFVLRYGVSRDIRGTTEDADGHGRGRIDAVPPGFYKMHLLGDYSITAVQDRGVREELGLLLASTGAESAKVSGANLFISAMPPCAVEAQPSGPMSGGCVGGSFSSERDPATDLCVLRNNDTGVAYSAYCAPVRYVVPAGVATRATHLIRYSADPARSELTTCGINLGAAAVDYQAVVKAAANCPGTTTPTAWSFSDTDPGRAACLGPEEKAAFPNGHPHDVRATYDLVAPLNATTKNLPVGVMTYTFKLPDLNTYTVAGLSFSYAAENAIIGVRLKVGPEGLTDGSNDLVYVGAPGVTSSPALKTSGTTGSIYQQWSLMSSNAATGTVSIVVIPTSYSSDLSAQHLASVAICNLALRVQTFAKRQYDTTVTRNGASLRTLYQSDGGLHHQIDPTQSRTRAVWNADAKRFDDLGDEPEDLSMSIHIPRNTTRAAPPPTYPATRRWHALEAPSGDPVIPADVWAPQTGVSVNAGARVDLRGGVTSLACQSAALIPGEGDLSYAKRTDFCRQWTQARASSALLEEFAPEMKVNGRALAAVVLDDAALTAAEAVTTGAPGIIGVGTTSRDDLGRSDGTSDGAFDDDVWARNGDAYAPGLRAGNFYEDPNMARTTLTAMWTTLQVVTDPATGRKTLVLKAGIPGGGAYTISSDLNCTTLNGQRICT